MRVNHTIKQDALAGKLSGKKIGFWGLGNMGAPMSERLLRSGAFVLGHDTKPEALRAHIARGGTADPSATLTDLDAVVLMLPHSDAVWSVLIDTDVAGSLRPGTIIIDMSSSVPLKTRQLSSMLKKRGLLFVDAPVSGGVSGAEEGTLAIMAGGEPEAFDLATPILEVLGQPRHVGDPGAGHALKALNNLLSATHLWATTEALLVGEQFGMDPSTMLAVLNQSSGMSGSTKNKWPKFILPGSYDSGFSLQLMLKDMRIATDLASQMGMPANLGNAAVEAWYQASKALPTDADHTEVARYLKSFREG